MTAPDAYGLAQKYPFVDGSERAAFMAAGVFPGLDDWYLDAPEGEATEMVWALSAKRIDEAAFAEWLERRSVPL